MGAQKAQEFVPLQTFRIKPYLPGSFYIICCDKYHLLGLHIIESPLITIELPKGGVFNPKGKMISPTFLSNQCHPRRPEDLTLAASFAPHCWQRVRNARARSACLLYLRSAKGRKHFGASVQIMQADGKPFLTRNQIFDFG